MLIRVSSALERAVGGWEADHGKVANLLTMKTADFAREKESLLTAMDGAVQGFIPVTDFSDAVKEMEQYEDEHPGVSWRQAQEIVARIMEARRLQ